MYKQMMRCYCHIFYAHWVDPFWHLNATKELNTCFIHFVNVGKLFGILDDKDMEPLRPLVEIWVDKGLLPATVTAGGSGSATPNAGGREGNSPAPQPPPSVSASAGASGAGQVGSA